MYKLLAYAHNRVYAHIYTYLTICAYANDRPVQHFLYGCVCRYTSTKSMQQLFVQLIRFFEYSFFNFSLRINASSSFPSASDTVTHSPLQIAKTFTYPCEWYYISCIHIYGRNDRLHHPKSLLNKLINHYS